MTIVVVNRVLGGWQVGNLVRELGQVVEFRVEVNWVSRLNSSTVINDVNVGWSSGSWVSSNGNLSRVNLGVGEGSILVNNNCPWVSSLVGDILAGYRSKVDACWSIEIWVVGLAAKSKIENAEVTSASSSSFNIRIYSREVAVEEGIEFRWNSSKWFSWGIESTVWILWSWVWKLLSSSNECE